MSNFSDLKTFDLTIYKPNEIYLTSKVKSVTIPSVLGAFQILINHAPIISNMEMGLVKIVNDNDVESLFLVVSGIAELHNNQLTLTVSEINKV